jgi:sugar (pentulose or hexulose) kinase
MIAGVGAGVYPDLAGAVRRVKRPGKVYAPRREWREAYAKAFARYRMLYPALGPVNRALNNPADLPTSP